MIMEDNKPQDLYLASWRPRKTYGIFPVWVPKPETQNGGFSPKAYRLQTQENWCFSLSQKARKDQCLSSKQSDRSSLSFRLFVLFRYLILWSPPTLRKAVCFTQLTNVNVKHISKHPHENTQKNIELNILASHGPVKLARTIKHYIYSSSF